MDRKQLIKELQMKFETKAKYLGVPSCAYEIKIQEATYTIDTKGRILAENGEEIQLKKLLNESLEVEAASSENMNYELKLPMEGHTAKTLRNLINMIYAKQPLIIKALGLKNEIFTETFVEIINETSTETLGDFKSLLNLSENYSNQGMVFNFDENTLSLKAELASEKLEASINLLALINKNALVKNYASYKGKPTTNEKYTFRTWLLRLGMVGDEYKKTRKDLLKNLSGNGAFKSQNKAGEKDEA